MVQQTFNYDELFSEHSKMMAWFSKHSGVMTLSSKPSNAMAWSSKLSGRMTCSSKPSGIRNLREFLDLLRKCQVLNRSLLQRDSYSLFIQCRISRKPKLLFLIRFATYHYCNILCIVAAHNHNLQCSGKH
jgi:hypothetical protein